MRWSSSRGRGRLSASSWTVGASVPPPPASGAAAWRGFWPTLCSGADSRARIWSACWATARTRA
eukprot:5367863-Pyramimonas_sp.AAC.1